MERVARIFRSHKEAEQASREYMDSLSPEERLEIQQELIARYREEHGIGEKLERVARLTTLQRG